MIDERSRILGTNDDRQTTIGKKWVRAAVGQEEGEVKRQKDDGR